LETQVSPLKKASTFAQIERRTLANGMRVWCVPRPNTGTVALMMHLPVGARTETPANNGISHLLEHMVFTGTERWDETQLTEVVRRRGGDCNAHTAREETVYYIHLSAEDMGFGMDWLHQLLFRPTLLAEKLDKEKQVITNEKGGEYDRLRQAWEWIEDHDIGWNVTRAARRRIYPDSAMLMPIIGTDQSLQQITHQELQNYYEQFYVADNMTLLVVGDIVTEEVFSLVETTFGHEPATQSPETHPPLEVVPTPFEINIRGPVPNEQGQLFIGAMLGPSGHDDRLRWSMLTEILEESYMRDIRYQEGLSYGVNVYPVMYTDTGYLTIYTSAQTHDLGRIRDVIEGHLDRLVAGDFREGEVAEAQAALHGRALLNMQDNLEMAWWLCQEALSFRAKDLQLPDYFEALRTTTDADIQQAAERYLAKEKRFYVEHWPILTPRRLRPWAAFGVAGLAATVLLSSRRRR
jgi:predicted Zn-dependent peptidase